MGDSMLQDRPGVLEQAVKSVVKAMDTFQEEAQGAKVKRLRVSEMLELKLWEKMEDSQKEQAPRCRHSDTNGALPSNAGKQCQEGEMRRRQNPPPETDITNEDQVQAGGEEKTAASDYHWCGGKAAAAFNFFVVVGKDMEVTRVDLPRVTVPAKLFLNEFRRAGGGLHPPGNSYYCVLPGYVHDGGWSESSCVLGEPRAANDIAEENAQEFKCVDVDILKGSQIWNEAENLDGKEAGTNATAVGTVCAGVAAMAVLYEDFVELARVVGHRGAIAIVVVSSEIGVAGGTAPDLWGSYGESMMDLPDSVAVTVKVGAGRRTGTLRRWGKVWAAVQEMDADVAGKENARAGLTM
eukprot:jgi/Psemu1/6332/gm1.6332_g